MFRNVGGIFVRIIAILALPMLFETINVDANKRNVSVKV